VQTAKTKYNIHVAQHVSTANAQQFLKESEKEDTSEGGSNNSSSSTSTGNNDMFPSLKNAPYSHFRIITGTKDLMCNCIEHFDVVSVEVVLLLFIVCLFQSRLLSGW
jgi:hypothetical protein